MEKVLFVIGASSDIGTSLIESVIDDYDVIIAHYNQMNDKLEKLSDSEKIICYQADLTNIEDIENMLNSIEDDNHIPTHIVHLPAKKIQIRKFHKTNWNVFQESLDISLRSITIIFKRFAPKMVKNKYGKLVVMLSMVVNNMPPKYNSDYVVSKYALLGFVKALAVEYAEYGICVNAVSPAMIDTKFVEKMHELIIEENAKESPTGKNLTVDEVVPSIKFLLSDESKCINGQNILITNGR